MLLAFTVRPFVNLNSSPIAETLIVNPFGDGTKSRSTAENPCSLAAVTTPSQRSLMWLKSSLAETNLTDNSRGCDMDAYISPATATTDL